MNRSEQIRNKERESFIVMIEKSWTYAKLTADEQFEIIGSLRDCPLYGANKNHIYETLHAVYHAFLAGAGYRDANGWDTWRQTLEEKGA